LAGRGELIADSPIHVRPTITTIGPSRGRFRR
jgi:hypothetical protein